MKMSHLLRASVATAAVTLAAQASAFSYVDDTTGSPTFTRALEDFSGLSDAGVDVAYDVFAFSVTDAGTYRFRSIAEGYFGGDDDDRVEDDDDLPWDQVLFLYQTSFDPDRPLINGLIGDDDFDGRLLSGVGTSGFDVALSPGVAYYLVTTGFEPEDQGAYLNLIRGPGEIVSVIPEPDSYALLAMGLGAVVLAVRGRRRGPV
jgi:PEP-CTERM motif